MPEDGVPDAIFEPWARPAMRWARRCVYPFVVVATLLIFWVLPGRSLTPAQRLVMLYPTAWMLGAIAVFELYVKHWRRMCREAFVEGTTCAGTIVRKRWCGRSTYPLVVDYALEGAARRATVYAPLRFYFDCTIGDAVTVRVLPRRPWMCVLVPTPG